MSIKNRLSNGTIDLGSGDTVIFTVAADTRIAVSDFSSYATSAETVVYFRSPDDTSANGEEIDRKIFAVNEPADISKLVGKGFEAGERIVANSTGTGVNASMSFSLFDGEDV